MSSSKASEMSSRSNISIMVISRLHMRTFSALVAAVYGLLSATASKDFGLWVFELAPFYSSMLGIRSETKKVNCTSALDYYEIRFGE